MSNIKFAETHNLVAFLEKPEESDGFKGIIDFLNASSIRYALTIQALVDGKKVIVTETSVRRALQLKDAEGTECLPNATIFAELERMGKDTEVPQPSGSTEPITDEAANEEHVPIHSNDPLLSDITKLKERVKKLERRNKSRIPGLKRVTLVDEAQGRNDDNLMFDTGVFDEHEVEVEKVVSTAEVTTVSATTTTVDELTLTQTLIEIKAAKPKAITTVVTRPKAIGVVVQEPSEFRTTTSSSQTSQLPQAKDKGKTKMIEPEKPLKNKDQILIDEEIAQKLQTQLKAESEEEQKLAKQREDDANIAEWDNVQAMIDADYELAARLQA
ncbi:hypothetical protein Tco_0009122 [Tanacetum coccineum]